MCMYLYMYIRINIWILSRLIFLGLVISLVPNAFAVGTVRQQMQLNKDFRKIFRLRIENTLQVTVLHSLMSIKKRITVNICLNFKT